MNRKEKIIENYLKSLGFSDIIYEPNGNVPPDFLVDKTIAIEVRRLNQQYFTPKGTDGLEEQRFPFFNLLESCLAEFNSKYQGNS